MIAFCCVLSITVLLLLKMPNITESNAFAGALGSIIGYLGSEVAEVAIFERLLWPQRSYYELTPKSAVGLAFTMPMGGPLYKAALQTLDSFRRRGLYKGKQQGHMLGTAFYQNTALRYTVHGYHGIDKDVEVRNGLWVRVLQHVEHDQTGILEAGRTKIDAESKGEGPQTYRRTSQWVHHLKLSVQDPRLATHEQVDHYFENQSSWKTYIAIFLSEASAVACAIVIFSWQHCHWFSAYLCLPLLLKLLAVPCSVRRGPERSCPSISQDKDEIVVFEVSDYDHGFPVIEGPESVVRQFFKHWGHPLREKSSDRLRELASMGLVVAFVLFFPAGLLSMLWVSEPVQTVWLLYQVYAIIVMHATRLIGFDGCGQMEAAMAESLSKGRVVCLEGGDGSKVEARLESYAVTRIAHGQEKVKEIVRHRLPARLLARSDSGVSTVVGDDDCTSKASSN
jgi:hypothetical protein